MRRSVSLLPAALLCAAVVSDAGGVSAASSQVLIQNDSNEDVFVSITDLNRPHGAIIASQHPLDANARWFTGAALDGAGAYHLHWKVEDRGRTKQQEGDCQATPVFACHVQLFFP